MDFESSSVMDDNDDHLVRTIGKRRGQVSGPKKNKKRTKKRVSRKRQTRKKTHKKRVKRKTTRRTKRKVKRGENIQHGGGPTKNIEKMLSICSMSEGGPLLRAPLKADPDATRGDQGQFNVLLVRHGISESNDLPKRREPGHGWIHPFLTELGRQQAYAFGYDTLYEKWIKDTSKPIRFFCSCLPRACETAKLISQGFHDRFEEEKPSNPAVDESDRPFTKDDLITLINGISEIPMKRGPGKSHKIHSWGLSFEKLVAPTAAAMTLDTTEAGSEYLTDSQRSMRVEFLPHVVTLLNRMDNGLGLKEPGENAENVENTVSNELVGWGGINGSGDSQNPPGILMTTEKTYLSFVSRMHEIFNQDAINVCVVHGKFIQEKMVTATTLSMFPVEESLKDHGDTFQTDTKNPAGISVGGGSMKGGGDTMEEELSGQIAAPPKNNLIIRKSYIKTNQLHLHVTGELGFHIKDDGTVQLKKNQEYSYLLSQLEDLKATEVAVTVPGEPVWNMTWPINADLSEDSETIKARRAAAKDQLKKFTFSLDGVTSEKILNIYFIGLMETMQYQFTHNLTILALMIDDTDRNPFRPPDLSEFGRWESNGNMTLKHINHPILSLSTVERAKQGKIMGWLVGHYERPHYLRKSETLKAIKERIKTLDDNDIISIKNLYLMMQFMGSKANELDFLAWTAMEAARLRPGRSSAPTRISDAFALIQKMHMYAYLKYSDDNDSDEAVTEMMEGVSNDAFRLYPPNLCGCDFTFAKPEVLDGLREGVLRTTASPEEGSRGKIELNRLLNGNKWEFFKISALLEARYYTPSLMALKYSVDRTYRDSDDPRVKLMRESVKLSHATRLIDWNREKMILESVNDGDERREATATGNHVNNLLNWVAPKPRPALTGMSHMDYETQKKEIIEELQSKYPVISGGVPPQPAAGYDYNLGTISTSPHP